MDINGVKSKIDMTAFLQGTVAVLLIWTGIIIYAFTQSGAVKEEMQSRMPVRTVLIEAVKPAVSVARVEAYPPTDIPQTPGVASPGMPEAVPSPDVNMPVVLEGLRSSPIEGLVENTPQGPLPQKREYDGMTPFNAYKRPYDFADDTPLVALLVKDFGLSQNLSREAMAKLPAEISFLVSPYSDDIQGISTAARNHGHETWLETPMENRGFEEADPGPTIIMSRSSLKDNEVVLRKLMALFHGYAGIAGFVDNSFNNFAATMMDALIGNAFERGIGYIDLNPDAPPLMPRLAFNYSAPYARADKQADDLAALEALEKKASENRFALGTIQLTPYNLKTIVSWIQSLKEKNITLIPASAIADAPTRLMGSMAAPPPEEPAAPANEDEAEESAEHSESKTHAEPETPAEHSEAPHPKDETHH